MHVPSKTLRARRRAAHGFTLMELMIVVMLIGILTVMALPTMAEARYNAHTLDDATKIAELFRTGRTRAMGRGAAMLLTSTSQGTLGGADLGTFTLYEGQIFGAGAATTLLPLPGGSPISTCGPPITNYWATVTNAANSPNTLIDQVNMNGVLEQTARMFSILNDGSGAAVNSASLCYTPLGRAYYQGGTLTPVFIPGVNLLKGSLQVTVQRSDNAGGQTGLVRTVIIPDSGSTRIVAR